MLQRTELSELTVGDQELTESFEAIEGFITVLLGFFLANRGIGRLEIAASYTSALIDEVLNEVAFIFGEQKQLGLLDDVSQVDNEVTALLRKLWRRLSQRLGVEGTVHSHIDLLVRWDLAIGKCSVNSIELELGVDVLLLDFLVRRNVDAPGLCHDCNFSSWLDGIT